MISSAFVGLFLFLISKIHGDTVGFGRSLWRNSVSTHGADISTHMKHYNRMGVLGVARGSSATGRSVRRLNNGWTLGDSPRAVSGLTGSRGRNFIQTSDDFGWPYDGSRDVWRNSAVDDLVDDYRFAQTPLHTDNTVRGLTNIVTRGYNRANRRPSSIGQTSAQYGWNQHFPATDVSATWGDNSMRGSLQIPAIVIRNRGQRRRDMSNIPTTAGPGAGYRSHNVQVDNFPRIFNNGVSKWQTGGATRLYGSKLFNSGHNGGVIGAWEGANRLSGSVNSGSPAYWGGAVNELAHTPFTHKTARAGRRGALARGFGARSTGGTAANGYRTRLTGGIVSRGYHTRSTGHDIAVGFGDRSTGGTAAGGFGAPSTSGFISGLGNRRRYRSGKKREY